MGGQVLYAETSARGLAYHPSIILVNSSEARATVPGTVSTFRQLDANSQVNHKLVDGLQCHSEHSAGLKL